MLPDFIKTFTGESRRNVFRLYWPGLVLLIIPPLIYSRMSLGYHGDVMLYFYRSRELLGLVPLPTGETIFEYPFFSYVSITLPHLLTFASPDPVHYKNAFIAVNAIFILSMFTILRKILEEYSYANLEFRLMGFISVCWFLQLLYFRLDLFPTLMSFLAFYFFLNSRFFLSGSFLAFGVMAKLYPVVFVLVALSVLIFRKKYRELTWLTFGGIFATISASLTYFLIFKRDFFDLLSFLAPHGQRGIQIESVTASLVLICRLVFGYPLSVIHNYGSHNLVFAHSGMVISGLLPLFGASMILLVFLLKYYYRSALPFSKEQEAIGLAVFHSLGLGFFVVFNKVFSPQYMIWFMPFVFLLPIRLCISFLIVFFLTGCLYPFLYTPLLNFETTAVIFLVARNFLLVATLVYMASGEFYKQVSGYRKKN